MDLLPREVVAELEEQRKRELQAAENNPEERYKIQKNILDAMTNGWIVEHGHLWLKSENIAQIVADEIHNLDGNLYRLLVYCIMPNHAHLLFESLLQELPHHKGKSAKSPIANTMRLLKGRTARYCNLALKRKGAFWRHESYDHYVRDESEMTRIIHYTINNPVKAGLVKEWKDWKFAYVNPELGDW